MMITEIERFEYGYSFSDGERIVLGSVYRSGYAKKAAKIEDANFISGGGMGHAPDGTTWFIDPLPEEHDTQGEAGR